MSNQIDIFNEGFFKEAAVLGMDVNFLKGLVAENNEAVQKWSAAFDEIEQQTGDKHFRFKVAGELAELLKDQPTTPMQKQANEMLQQILQWAQENPELTGGGIGGLLGLLLGHSAGHPLMGLMMGGLGGAGLGHFGKMQNWWGRRGLTEDPAAAQARIEENTGGPKQAITPGASSGSHDTEQNLLDEQLADQTREEENTGGPQQTILAGPQPAGPLADPAQAAYDRPGEGSNTAENNFSDDPEAVSRGHTQLSPQPGQPQRAAANPPGLVHDPQFNYNQQEHLNAGNPLLDPRLRGADQVMQHRVGSGIASPEHFAQYNAARRKIDLLAQQAGHRREGGHLGEQIDSSWWLNPAGNVQRVVDETIRTPIRQGAGLLRDTYQGSVNDIAEGMFTGAQKAQQAGTDIRQGVRTGVQQTNQAVHNGLQQARKLPGRINEANSELFNPVQPAGQPVPRVRPPLALPQAGTNSSIVPNGRPVVPPVQPAQPR